MADTASSFICDRCNETKATVICLGCERLPFCDRCFQEVHRKGKFQQHQTVGDTRRESLGGSSASDSQESYSSASTMSVEDNSLLSDSTNTFDNQDSTDSSTSETVKLKPMRTPRTPANTPHTSKMLSPSKTNERDGITPKHSDADIGESAFFAFVQTKLEDSIDDYKAMSSVDHEKAKFLRLLEEERKRNETERKELEERIQQEEQLRQQMTSLSVQRQQDHSKSLQSIAAENLQIKEGIENLQIEMRRIQAEKIALQDRIKASFGIFDQEKKELQKVADSIQDEIAAVKKEKKVLIDKITELTFGKLSRTNTPQLQSSNPLTTSSSSQK